MFIQFIGLSNLSTLFLSGHLYSILGNISNSIRHSLFQLGLLTCEVEVDWGRHALRRRFAKVEHAGRER
ncbi:MAG: hypothetical protein AAB067_01775, partial [Planctomycetota bacterium]